jgi:hypothetical protein
MPGNVTLAAVAVVVFASQAWAQPQRPQLSSTDAQRLEAAIVSNPHDRASRGALLDFYFLGGAEPAVAVPARRRHILWLIENTPEDQLAGSPAATIDAAGHSLADPRGFKLASDAWRAQVAKAAVKPAALVNAAYFFKTDDKAFTISLLERALALEPSSKEIAARLGDEYALAIMGVTMINRNGYPMRADPNLTQSTLAKNAREALTTSRNPYLVAKAGYMLLWQGAILYYSRRIPFDTAPLAKSTLDRAVSLAPGDPDVAGYRAQYDAFQSEKRGLPNRAGGGDFAQPASPLPVLKEATPDDLKKVATGTTRDELLKLGSPAGRITMDDDCHLVEIFQYSDKSGPLGTIRLTDGTVTSVQIP